MSDPEDTAANEQQPLLQDPAEADHGTIQRQSDGTPLAEEPTTARLTVVLGTVWVGVFLAALGMDIELHAKRRLKGTQDLTLNRSNNCCQSHRTNLR